MRIISSVVGIFAISGISTACGSLTPEQEAAEFLESVSECLTDNRDELAQGLDNLDPDAGAEAFEELCGLDRAYCQKRRRRSSRRREPKRSTG